MADPKYKALVILTKDPRTPLAFLERESGATFEEILEVVADTGAKHYRLLGFLPPSELYPGTVQDFYAALGESNLAELVESSDGTSRYVGCRPSPAIRHLCINVPCYGSHWHAFHPDLLRLILDDAEAEEAIDLLVDYRRY